MLWDEHLCFTVQPYYRPQIMEPDNHKLKPRTKQTFPPHKTNNLRHFMTVTESQRSSAVSSRQAPATPCWNFWGFTIKEEKKRNKISLTSFHIVNMTEWNNMVFAKKLKSSVWKWGFCKLPCLMVTMLVDKSKVPRPLEGGRGGRRGKREGGRERRRETDTETNRQTDTERDWTNFVKTVTPVFSIRLTNLCVLGEELLFYRFNGCSNKGKGSGLYLASGLLHTP